ncbi:hypothetical protein E4188_23770 (plasmid) [Aeromonas media]|uniref:Uncharacterized protein n=3 Tax=Aeromonas TaxID=642 RepID=A0ABX6P1T6_AERME|nr:MULTISPECIES: hypothetical protein [Aeromonas]ASI21463.1 hypothetical protein CE456_01040 [Aeromonas salmonicida]QJT41510.1 hypothetical protein E4188_23770 [Aeromonas media]QLI59090.1 hypothetical protein C0708_23365 [Aeromonas caviae]QLI60317.1 hypothetical protein C1C91_23010 [Aeromonas caviae]HDN9373714.1 hypothetical protein [Aeromonas salmonicida]
MRKYLLFIFYILAVLFCSILLILLVDTKSEAWQQFSRWATVAKWIIVPSLIIVLPKIIERVTKMELTKEGKKLLLQSQILMGVAFTAVEIMHGAL